MSFPGPESWSPSPEITDPAGFDLFIEQCRMANLIHVDATGALEWRAEIDNSHKTHGVDQWNFASPTGVLYFMYKSFYTQEGSRIISAPEEEKLSIDPASFFRDNNGKMRILSASSIGPNNILPSLKELSPPTHDTLVQRLIGKNHLALFGSIDPFSAISLKKVLEKEYMSKGLLDLFEINAGILQMFNLMNVYENSQLAISPRIQTNLVEFVLNSNFQLPMYDALFLDVLGTYIRDDVTLEHFLSNLVRFVKPGGVIIMRDIGSKKVPDSQKLISNQPPTAITGFVYWLNHKAKFQGGEVSQEKVSESLINLWGDSGASRYESLNKIYHEAFSRWMNEGLVQVLCNGNTAIDGVSPSTRYLKTMVVKRNV